MAITQILEEGGNCTYMVYVNLRSKKMPHIRKQKRVCGIPSKAEAIRKEKKLIKEVSLKIAHEEGHGFTWRMIISRWATSVATSNLSKKYNPITIRDYVNMLHKWTKDWLDFPASKLTRGDGKEVLEDVIEAGKTKAFQKRLKNTINMIYNWAIEEKLILGVHNSPVTGIKITVNQEKRPEILKKDEIVKLLYEAKRLNHDWYYIWAMALLTGMRNGELFALRWSNVDFDRAIINVERSFNFYTKEYKETKAGYWRSVPISSELKSLLLEMKINSKTEFVLPKLHLWKKKKQARVLKIFCKSIGIPEVRFHTLRACFATQLIGSGIEPVKVMKICGWKDLKTLAIYLRLAGVDEKGATEGLSFLPKNEGPNILELSR
jgi:integrase